MENTGKNGNIQISPTTADLLEEAGKSAWSTPREDLITAKGKGHIQTYWVAAQSNKCENVILEGENAGLLMVLGFCLVPTMQVPYEGWLMPPEKDSFKSTKTFHIMDTLSQVAKIAMLVYVVDILKIFLLGAGFSSSADRCRFRHSIVLATPVTSLARTMWRATLGLAIAPELASSLVDQTIGVTEAMVRRRVEHKLYSLRLRIIEDCLTPFCRSALESEEDRGLLDVGTDVATMGFSVTRTDSQHTQP
jgi:hypothetical protein